MTIDPELQEMAKSVFSEELEKVLPRFSEFQKELPNLDSVVRDGALPLTPRLFLVKAMDDYKFGHFYSAVLLAGAAVEIGLREFLQRELGKYMDETRPKSMVTRLLDEFDFRKATAICEDFEVFGDKKQAAYGILHQCYDVRNKYSHANLTKILGKMEGEPLIGTDRDGNKFEFGTIGENELLRNVYAETLVAREDALALIGLVGKAFDIMRRFKL